MSRELEEEALQRESEVDKQLKGLAAAAAVIEHKRIEELKSKDQQIAELQVEYWLIRAGNGPMLLYIWPHSPCDWLVHVAKTETQCFLTVCTVVHVIATSL